MFPFSRTLLRRAVVVNLKSGKGFRGVVWARRGPLVVLRGAVMVEGAQEFPVDGEVVLERSVIEFVQVVP